MKHHVKKEERKTHQPTSHTTVHDYGASVNDIGAIVMEFSGRYPHEGADIDENVDHIWYIEEGEGDIHIDDASYFVEPGGMITIPRNSQYWVETTHLKVVIMTNAPWHPKH
jgi:mannose-6-phosphate isomerase-like protein (cupin superfamily)